MPRYIEVKATKPGALTTFYITSAELDFPHRHQGDMRSTSCSNRVLQAGGDLDTLLAVEPVTYHVRPAQPGIDGRHDTAKDA
jgi:hypothetical protein